MAFVKLLLLFIFFSTTVRAQKNTADEFAAIDAKALQIPDSLTTGTAGIASYINSNFSIHKEKLRAIFIWVATNIEYDTENMFAINFYEQTEEKISKPLKSHKGICENFAALFNALCEKTGIPCFVIEGYTKQNGFADYIPHAWCAAYADSAWMLFDPTWGSGYINGGQFYKKISNNYFNVAPAEFINSHMPFDPLWQLLHYPLTNQEFYEGKTKPDTTKTYFSYEDSIRAFQQQAYSEQLQSTAIRLEKNGMKNALIYNRLQYLKMKMEQEKQNQYNDAVFEYNDATSFYNEYIRYWNKHFIPVRTDAEIQSMMDSIIIKLNTAKQQLNAIQQPSGGIALMMQQLTRSITEAMVQADEEQAWLKKYFTRDRSKRGSMFLQKRTTAF